MKRHALARGLLSTALLAISPPVLAGDGAKASLSILPGWRADNGTHVAALRIMLAPDWVTYWRIPGDAGIPPQLDLQDSNSISGASLSWPRPTAEVKNGLRSFVYYDEVIVPLTLSISAEAQDVPISGQINIGVCQDVCIPTVIKFNAILPAQKTAPDPKIAAALANGPRKGSARIECQFAPSPEGMSLQVTLNSPAIDNKEVAIVEHRDPTTWTRTTGQERSGNRLSVSSEIISDGTMPSLQRRDIRLTMLGQKEMIEYDGCSAPS
ncbi:protein-disulfide reductase DsbD domain-containing protein [Falsihalocynthiibacter sp. SS001]|uniref:protein-disulfide reductase DsbD domain-containing protein n=1 Tax=Falsihalocynthiibacter sp. SS001 TaxID=3349698 RepID=UPI0036D39AAE